MDLTIQQNCPSCGGSISLFENDRFIRCEYCDVGNYRLESGAGRYILPSKLPGYISFDQLFYIPYLRFKGAIFYIREKEVDHKIVDTTRIGIDEEKLPVSLGLRPQAMRLQPVVARFQGAFVKQSVPTEAAFTHAGMITEVFSGKGNKTFYHRVFIGETLSRIYLPCYLHEERLYDAIVNEPLGPESLLTRHRGHISPSKVAWEPQFISTICPRCSGLLNGEPDSLVLHCQNCESLWQENGTTFQPLPWQVIQSDDPAAHYLPFWQIAFTTEEPALQSFGDYLRFTNQPMVVDSRFDAMPLSFVIPAFKINPKMFLQIASHMTVSQRRLPKARDGWIENRYPVNLPQKEAEQSIKTVLASTTLNKTKRLPLLPKMTIRNPCCRLMYVPFVEQSQDLVQEHTLTTIFPGALRFGRKL
ncbi:MAG: hypothetical protein OEL83_20785 [Desulforhopalus sp.]|nr:hypothetical protein [Desulforhopalus sp.]